MEATTPMSAGVGVYCVVVAVIMASWWALEIRHGAMSRPDRRRAEIRLHVAGELLTAAALLIGGLWLIAGEEKMLALVGLGMLMYTVVVSPGYFVARHELAPVAMFAVLTVMTWLGAAPQWGDVPSRTTKHSPAGHPAPTRS